MGMVVAEDLRRSKPIPLQVRTRPLNRGCIHVNANLLYSKFTDRLIDVIRMDGGLTKY